MKYNIYWLMKIATRNKAMREKPIVEEAFIQGECKRCGAPLLQYKRRRRRIFCSDECRTEWRKYGAIIEEKKMTMGKCKYCGDEFKKNNRGKNKQFCSDRCRMHWWSEAYSRDKSRMQRTYECSYCHKEFKTYSVRPRKYCSRECYFRDRFDK